MITAESQITALLYGQRYLPDNGYLAPFVLLASVPSLSRSAFAPGRCVQYRALLRRHDPRALQKTAASKRKGNPKAGPKKSVKQEKIEELERFFRLLRYHIAVDPQGATKPMRNRADTNSSPMAHTNKLVMDICQLSGPGQESEQIKADFYKLQSQLKMRLNETKQDGQSESFRRGSGARRRSEPDVTDDDALESWTIASPVSFLFTHHGSKCSEVPTV